MWKNFGKTAFNKAINDTEITVEEFEGPTGNKKLRVQVSRSIYK